MLKKFGFKFVVITAIALSLVTDSMAATTRIRFARGASSTSLSGSLTSGGSRSFVVRLGYGQTFSVNVSSGNDEIVIKASDVHGAFNEEYGYFETETDAEGDHYITIRNTGRRSTRYTMTVSAY
ncbi:MAG TPA: hypothetical protein PKE69_15240 [Pyrinomonadaceae bacterium]|nr:hypothetical protein [Pyrinomonadaceae bacterium]